MLPFIKRDIPASTTSIIKRKPDGSTEPEMEDSSADGLEACAEDFLRAVHMKDTKAMADAFRAAFEICDSSPHVEGEHLNDNENKD